MKNIVLAVVLSLACGTLAAAEVIEAIVARVGDRVITRSQYIERYREGLEELQRMTPPEQLAEKSADFKSKLLDVMLSELLLKDRADRLNLTVSPAEILEALKRLQAQYGIKSEEEFNASLEKSGMTRAQMEARLRDTLLTNKLFGRELRSREELTDRELRERYERERESYRLPERAQLREIIVLIPEGNAAQAFESAKARAEEAAARAARGEEFKTLVDEYSQAPSKAQGGDIGVVARGEMIPQLDTAVFNSAPTATVVGPIQTRAGFHVLRIESRMPSEVPSFESVKDRLRRDASEETFQRDYKAYIENLRKDAFIKVNDDQMPKS